MNYYNAQFSRVYQMRMLKIMKKVMMPLHFLIPFFFPFITSYFQFFFGHFILLGFVTWILSNLLGGNLLSLEFCGKSPDVLPAH